MLSGLLFLLSFQLGSVAVIAPFMIALGVAGSFIPAATCTLAPETMPDPRFAGLALGIVSVGQNRRMFLGPPVIGAVVASGDWGAGTVPLVASIAIGAAASLILRARHAQTPAALTEA